MRAASGRSVRPVAADSRARQPSPPGLKWHTLSLLKEPTGDIALAAYGGQKQAPRPGGGLGEPLEVHRRLATCLVRDAETSCLGR